MIDLSTILIACILLLSVGVFILLYLYIKSNQKISQLLNTPQHTPHIIHERALRHLEHTKEQAYSILETAEKKAAMTIERAELLKASTESDMQEILKHMTDTEEKKLQEASKDLIKAYEAQIEQLTKDNIILLKSISNTMQGDAENQVKSFSQALNNETIKVEETARQNVEGAYAQIRGELAAYKKQRMEEIDREVYTALQQITEEILGKALNVQEHQKLIIAALAQAKNKKDILL